MILTLTALLAMFASDDVWDSKETRQIQAKFAECAVEKNPASAMRMVLEPNLSDAAWSSRFSRVADKYCLAGKIEGHDWVRMTFPLDTMRYLLADALVRREFKPGAPSSIKDAAPLEQPTFDQPRYQFHGGRRLKASQLEQSRINREIRVGMIFLTEFGECVVRANPANSHALLMAQASSPDEEAAFQNLAPEFEACLPAGKKLEFIKANLRGTIAVNFYRLAHAPRRVVPAGAAK